MKQVSQVDELEHPAGDNVYCAAGALKAGIMKEENAKKDAITRFYRENIENLPSEFRIELY